MITIQDLVSAAQIQLELELDLARTEDEVKQIKEKLRTQSQEVVPNMMMELGLEKITLPGGYEINISDQIQGTLPKDIERCERAFEWLRERGLDGIIKTQVSYQFGKGEDDEAQRIIDILTEAGIVPNVQSTIHHMTLKSFIREQLVSGSGIPLDDFGAEVIKTSVIRSPKS